MIYISIIYSKVTIFMRSNRKRRNPLILLSRSSTQELYLVLEVIVAHYFEMKTPLYVEDLQITEEQNFSMYFSALIYSCKLGFGGIFVSINFNAWVGLILST